MHFKNVLPNVITFLAIVVINDSDGNEENAEDCSPTKVSKVSNRSLLRVVHD